MTGQDSIALRIFTASQRLSGDANAAARSVFAGDATPVQGFQFHCIYKLSSSTFTTTVFYRQWHPYTFSY